MATTTESLTTEQKLFLEECEVEFCDRFTESDMEYKLVKEAGIPPPPLMFPWNPKSGRFRGPSGSGRYSNYRRGNDRRREPDYRNYSNSYRDRSEDRRSRYDDRRDTNDYRRDRNEDRRDRNEDRRDRNEDRRYR